MHILTLQRNLISLAIFNTIFEKLVVAYFLGHPVDVESKPHGTRLVYSWNLDAPDGLSRIVLPESI